MIDGILHFLSAEFLYSTVVLLLIFLLSRLFSKQPPLFLHGLWLLVLVRAVLPPSLEFQFSLRSLFDLVAARLSPQHAMDAFFTGGLEMNTVPSFQITSAATNSGIDWRFLVLTIWCLGMLFVAALYFVKIRQYNTILKNAFDCRQPAVIKDVDFWRTEFGVKRMVRLVTSESHFSPFTKGIFKPVIFIPQQIIGTADCGLIASIIAHEMAHIKRKDAQLLKLQTFLQIIYFFNPAVWVANFRINYFRELICDGMVLSTGKIDKNIYGESLLNILNMRLSTPGHIQLHSGIGTSKLRSRIQNIMEGHKMKRNRSIFNLLSILAVALFVLPLANKGSAKVVFAPAIVTAGSPEFGLPLKSGEVKVKFGVLRETDDGARTKHIGIDIAAKKGTEVYAVQAGTVEKAIVPSKEKMNNGYGKYILINHGNGLKSLYSHLSEISVSEGAAVVLGQAIGTVGNSGKSTGPHLHFEMIKHGERVDPELYTDFGQLKK